MAKRKKEIDYKPHLHNVIGKELKDIEMNEETNELIFHFAGINVKIKSGDLRISVEKEEIIDGN